MCEGTAILPRGHSPEPNEKVEVRMKVKKKKTLLKGVLSDNKIKNKQTEECLSGGTTS